MIIEIKRTNGRWLINGKPYSEINDEEKEFFDSFIIFMKQQNII